MASFYNRNTPKHTWGTGWTKETATQKQTALIVTLAAKANITVQNLDQLTRGGASGLIDELQRAARGEINRRYLERWSKYIVL